MHLAGARQGRALPCALGTLQAALCCGYGALLAAVLVLGQWAALSASSSHQLLLGPQNPQLRGMGLLSLLCFDRGLCLQLLELQQQVLLLMQLCQDCLLLLAMLVVSSATTQVCGSLGRPVLFLLASRCVTRPAALQPHLLLLLLLFGPWHLRA